MKEQFPFVNIDDAPQHLTNTRDIGAYLENITMLSRLKAAQSTRRRVRTRSVGDRSEDDVKVLIRSWLQQNGYITIVTQSESYAIKSDAPSSCVEQYIRYKLDDETVTMIVHGDEAESNKVVDWMESTFNELGSLISTASHFDDRGNLIFDRKYMLEGKVDLAKPSFYPWLSVSMEEYFKTFMESEEAVLVLIGDPGTGKSTFLRTLINSGKYRSYLAFNKGVVESPKLITQYYASGATILAYEDIDNYLGDRKEGNTLMSTILNASEGIVKHPKKKIVFSTNLASIDKIDPALLRVGRCFDILKFEKLTREQAEAVRVDMNLPERSWDEKSSWSLAEVLSKHNPVQQTVNRFAKKIGFN